MKQRLSAEPVRIIHDIGMPDEMLNDLRKRLRISNIDTIQAAGHYRNFKDFIGFPNVGRAYLEHKKLPLIRSKAFNDHDTVFEAISNKDILLEYVSSVSHCLHSMPYFASKSDVIEFFIKEFDIQLLALVHYRHGFLEELVKEPVVKRIAFHTPIPLLVLPD